MKKMNKKGFTIVELVIVIAVIAILAAVMIPTFSGIIDKANESAAKQQYMAAYKEGLAMALSDGQIDGTDVQAVDGGNFQVTFTSGTYEAKVVCGKLTGSPAAFAADGEINGYKSASISADGEITLSTNP